MLEVHPPHHALNTWRDFFIHITTIVIGLLIAIGLEQSVEALHNRQQRFALEHDLRVEAAKNLRLFALDDVFYDDKTVRLTSLRRYVEDLRGRRLQKFPPSNQPVPDIGSPIFWFPTISVWKTAKEGMFLSLLPRDEVAMFEEVYFENHRMRLTADKYFDTLGVQRRFAGTFNDQYDPAVPRPLSADASTLERMTPDELKEYSVRISNALDALQESRFVTNLARNASTAVLNGARSAEDVDKELAGDTSDD
ncbi:MAG: hypothetical protein WDN23_18615 [Edaphobacter sp.]